MEVSNVVRFPVHKTFRLVTPTPPKIVALWAELHAAIAEYHKHPAPGTKHVMEQTRDRYIRALRDADESA